MTRVAYPWKSVPKRSKIAVSAALGVAVLGSAIAASVASASGASARSAAASDRMPGPSAVVAVVGPDERLDVYEQAAGSAKWVSEQVAGNFMARSNPSVARVGRTTIVAVVGPDERVDVYEQAIGSATWVRQQASGNLMARSDPKVELNP